MEIESSSDSTPVAWSRVKKPSGKQFPVHSVTCSETVSQETISRKTRTLNVHDEINNFKNIIETYRINPASKIKVASPTPSTESLSTVECSSPQSKVIIVTSVVDDEVVVVVGSCSGVGEIVVVVVVVVEVVVVALVVGVGASEDTNRES